MSSNFNAIEAFGWVDLWAQYPARARKLMRMYRADRGNLARDFAGTLAARAFLKAQLQQHEDWRKLNG